jgi:putative restriction endonuclease
VSRWRQVVRRELAAYRRSTGYDVVDLGDVYAELLPVVREAFPENDHPKAKVRQVLQQLRDRGEVAFLGDGVYRLVDLDVGSAAADVAADRAYAATTYETTIGARSMPAGFRRVVLEDYGCRCPISGVDRERLLDVAHVLPWSEHPDRRTDPGNVLALDRTHHAAFDAALFTVSKEYRVRVAPGFETDSDVLTGTLVERDGEPVAWPARAPDISDALARRNRSLEWDVRA